MPGGQANDFVSKGYFVIPVIVGTPGLHVRQRFLRKKPMRDKPMQLALHGIIKNPLQIPPHLAMRDPVVDFVAIVANIPPEDIRSVLLWFAGGHERCQ